MIKMILTVTFIFALCACGEKAPTWQEQYDLGVRYLSEGKYEEAILAFTAAIEIEPKRSEAYVGLAEAYEATGDVDAALAILQQGIDATGDAGLTAARKTLLNASTPPEEVPTDPNRPATITIGGQTISTDVTELDLSSMDLTDEDIEPLKWCTDLMSLNLRDNQISDMSPLSGLSNLTELELYDNQISDLSPLSGLTELMFV